MINKVSLEVLGTKDFKTISMFKLKGYDTDFLNPSLTKTFLEYHTYSLHLLTLLLEHSRHLSK